MRVFETVLYSSDLPAMERFYHEVMGLELISRSELVISFRLEGSVLLIFDPLMSRPEGREVPSHGTTGEGHIAFATREDEVDGWLHRLAEANVEIEAIVNWKQGGRSIYFRDPEGNSLECAEPKLWNL